MSIHCKLSVLMGEKRYQIQNVHEKMGFARTIISNLYHDRMERVDYQH
jgi:putative transcriptional regulator